MRLEDWRDRVRGRGTRLRNSGSKVGKLWKPRMGGETVEYGGQTCSCGEWCSDEGLCD